MKLIQHVLHIRGLIHQAFCNRFDRMGLHPDSSEPVDSLPEEMKASRQRLDDILSNHLSALGNYAEARKQAIGECTFTLFNRIASIKVMEDRELFPEVIRRRTEYANRSFAHNAWLEEHPEERNAEREGLKHFLSDKFAELGERLPVYRSDYPYSLLPTADELFQIIVAFNAVELDSDCGADIWKGDDILGWLYENFNATEKVELKESGAKTEYDKVSLQSQVYTPQWVVKFLVDNTLGKLYMEMYPDSELTNMTNEDGTRKYLIANTPRRDAIAKRAPKKPTELKLIDPACGSGNFLLYACDLLYDIYLNQVDQYDADYSRHDIPKLIIENNIYGVDLDERAVQITQIALYIKAWQLGGRRGKTPGHVNVVSTRFFLPEWEQVEMAFMMGDEWQPEQRTIIREVWNDLRNAYKFGSLIRVEEKFDKLLPVDGQDMFANEWKRGMFEFRSQMITQLHNQVSTWSGEGSNPYSLSKASDAITFLDILSNKFDVAVANPPYTDSSDFGKDLKQFMEDNYKKPLKFNINLYAAFIKRCCELTADDGKVGMIHPMTFMYIKTFEDTRKFILNKTHINLFVEYGLDRINMFKGTGYASAPAFYTLDKEKANETQDGIYFKILDNQQERDKKESLLHAYEDFLNSKGHDRVYHLQQSKLKGIKSWPFIYWISDEFREKFTQFYLDKMATIVSGMKTGNNEGALRFWWEETNHYNWKSYTKGGFYNKWYGNNWLVINSTNDFKYIKSQSSYSIPKVIGTDGITYNGLGSKGLSCRYLENTTLYDMGSSSVFLNRLFESLAILNSLLIKYSINCLNPTVNIQPSDVKRLPFVDFSLVKDNALNILKCLSLQCVCIKKKLCKYSLIEPLFKQSPISTSSDPRTEIANYYNEENALLTQVLLNEAIINDIVFDIYELNTHDRQMVIDKEGAPVGSLPVSSKALAYYKDILLANEELFPATDELKAYIDHLPVSEEQPQIKDFDTLYQKNNDWEEFCIKHKVNPIEACYQFYKVRVLPPQRTQTLAFELVTDVIRTVLEKDDDGVIPLMERSGEEQLALRIEAELVERGYSSAQISGIFALLGMPLDKYLLTRFFQQLSDHLNLFMYLPKTPFIWHISSGEHHALELYVSIYKWSRDTLYRLKSIYSGNRETALGDQLAALQERNDAASKIEADEIKQQIEELHTFNTKVEDLLASGYDPKLDDGVGKNIAPLQKRGMISYEVLNAGQLKKYLNADW